MSHARLAGQDYLVLVVLLFLGCMGIGLAHAQPTPPPAPADPGQAVPPPGPEAQTPGQLMVRVLLPPGIPAAVLSLNGAYAAPLPGGVLAAPLALIPGGYYAQISAPGARSYEAPFQVAPGQLVEINGALQPETGVAPSYVGVTPGVTPGRAPSPFSPSAPVTARRVGRKIVLGVVLGVLGVALTAGILTAALCGAGKCKGSSDHHD